MRLWSLHPRYLDSKGLVAAWREALLAKAVLSGATRGYQNHPQLERFKEQTNPIAAIDAYLRGIHVESITRGYNFDGEKLGSLTVHPKILVTAGQLDFELNHLRAKLEIRSPSKLESLTKIVEPHPLFKVRPGAVESWERGAT